MSKKLNNKIHQAFRGFTYVPSELNASFQSNIHKAFTLTCRGFFDSIRSILPKSSLADYIELKTTSGGLTLIKSMIQIPLSFTLTSTFNAHPAKCDLTQLKDNAVKLNYRSMIDTSEMDVKGLIELMYQF
jgi:hypothetical protein